VYRWQQSLAQNQRQSKTISMQTKGWLQLIKNLFVRHLISQTRTDRFGAATLVFLLLRIDQEIGMALFFKGQQLAIPF
jgi:hypothetical protein